MEFDTHAAPVEDRDVSLSPPLSLKEVQALLGVQPHVLIHLCEKAVVQPDFAPAGGRGRRRGFSTRNVFEFGVALALRKFELPVTTTAIVVRLLRSFFQVVSRLAPSVQLPDALSKGAVDLHLSLYDADLLVLSGHGQRFNDQIVLGARIGVVLQGSTAAPRVSRLKVAPTKFEARLDVDLCEIARKVLK